MNKKTIIYASIAVVIFAGLIVLLITQMRGLQQTGAPVLPEDSFESEASIEEGVLGEYGKALNAMTLEELDEEFSEIDGIINQL
jgi:hypothetical protein